MRIQTDVVVIYLFVLCDELFFAIFYFFKQKTAYEMRISDWSSDVCSSDLTWSPQCFMSRRSCDICNLDRRRIDTSGNQTCHMCHIHYQVSSNRISDVDRKSVV